jgi:hypothetical protein
MDSAVTLDHGPAAPVVWRLEKDGTDARLDEFPGKPISAREGLFAQRPEMDADAAHAIARRQVDANARARRFTWKERRWTRKFAFVRACAEDAEDLEAAAFEGRRHGRRFATVPDFFPEHVERGPITPTSSVE